MWDKVMVNFTRTMYWACF